jgi:hypothetical protein
MENPEKIEIEGLKTIHKLCKFGADHNMEGCSFTEIVERMFSKIEQMKTQVNTLDEMLLNQGEALAQAKAQAVPEGFVLVEKSKIRTWYQDDDEPENFCNSESDLNCLGDCLDDDDIIAVNIHESAHISTRKVFGVWKSNSPTDIQSNFVLVDSREKAEEIVASNKAMIEAQEPAND